MEGIYQESEPISDLKVGQIKDMNLVSLEDGSLFFIKALPNGDYNLMVELLDSLSHYPHLRFTIEKAEKREVEVMLKSI